MTVNKQEYIDLKKMSRFNQAPANREYVQRLTHSRNEKI
jgi:hypothetical protein